MVKLVGPSWVEERLDSREVLVLDPRGRMRHLQGHLKGAISVPATSLFGDNQRLLPVEELSERFGAAGLDDTVVPVLYDSYDGQRGAMLAWALEYLGRSDVYLMDTFFEGWAVERRHVFYRPVEPQPRSFTPRVVTGVRATLEDVRSGAATRLLDVRSVEEFAGQSDVDDRPGHIPGAANVMWRAFLGPGHEYLDSAENIKRRLSDSDISDGDSVITYCRVGMRAALGYLALRQLGYDVRLYDGSYAEWSTAGLPVETSSPPARR